MKIVFISFHHYVTKAQGGFHSFAKEFAKENDVVFFSYPRSWFVYLRKLSRDPMYNELIPIINHPPRVDNILNVSALFFLLPQKILKYMPEFIIELSHRLTFGGFKRFCKRYFSDADCFVFESTPSIYLEKSIRKQFPAAKIVYRPSDPIIANKLLSLYHKREIDFMKNADMNFIVNKEGMSKYKKMIPDFDETVKYTIISNGVNSKSYTEIYPKPENLKGKKTAVYIGAAPIEWNLVIESAKTITDVDFYIIFPAKAPQYFMDAVNNSKNLHFINGILPKEVPAYITNADLVIVPYETDRYKNFAWGITAKYYQAMAAKRPIIAYHDTHDLEQLNIRVADTYEQFIDYLREVKYGEKVSYEFDFRSKEWPYLAKQMLDIIKSL